MIDFITKEKIQQIISVFETSSLKPDYSAIAILKDGKNGKPQITYGKHQTSEGGNLRELLTRYCNSYGKYARDIRPYLSKIGYGELVNNMGFRQLLKSAGQDPTMHEVQDKFFDELYWNPAYLFFTRNGFTLPLSMAVIYDSFIQSGSILKFLRDKFSEMPPAQNGNEKEWIQDYVLARDKWLESNKSKTLSFTDYRTDTFIDAIKKDNWSLLKPIICKFNSSSNVGWVTIS